MPEPFSLLLPVYREDRPEFLAAAFASSVVHQVLRPSEVVIVRDGPVGQELQDELAAIVASSPVPTIVVALEDNVGLARALEAGLARCMNDIVARMDADDLSYSRRFAVQLPMLLGGLDVVGSAIHEFVIDQQGNRRIVGTRTPPTEQGAIAAQMPFHNPFNHPSVVFRKSAVLRSGGYEALGVMEDYWLFARMLADGARAGNSTEALVGYRVNVGAYARRGGWRLFASELRLQRAFRVRGITTRLQFLRNVMLRGGYRLVPEPIRKLAYRAAFVARAPRREATDGNLP